MLMYQYLWDSISKLIGNEKRVVNVYKVHSFFDVRSLTCLFKIVTLLTHLF